MNLEKENSKKRKKIPLTVSEAVWFFFFPSGFFKLDKSKSTDFNESELERFEKYGYNLKLEQAQKLKKYGILFYISIAIILAYLLR